MDSNEQPQGLSAMQQHMADRPMRMARREFDDALASLRREVPRFLREGRPTPDDAQRFHELARLATGAAQTILGEAANPQPTAGDCPPTTPSAS